MKTLFITALFFISLSAFCYGQITYTLNQHGAWTDPTSWQPQGIPGSGDFIIINNRTLEVNGSFEIAGFKLSDGTVLFEGVNSSITITDSADWTHGEFDGGGIENKCSLIVAPGALLVISTDTTEPETHRLYEGTTLINKGTIRHTGSTNLGIRGNSVLYNESLYDLRSDADFGGESFSGGYFINTGTFRKSAGSGVSSINLWWVFTNQGGNIDIQSGIFDFNCDAEFINGTYNASAGAMLRFSSHIITPRGTLSGSPSGDILLSDAFISTDSSEVIFDFKEKGFQWEAGQLNGTGTLTVAENSLLVLKGESEYPVLYTGTAINNNGTIIISGSKALSTRSGAYIYNNGLLEITNDTYFTGTAGTGTLVNTGTLRKSGGDSITTMSSWLNLINDEGRIEVNSGKLQLSNNCTFNGGSYEIVQNSEIILAGATKTFKGVLSGSPEGNFRIADATINTDSTGAVLNIQGTGLIWEAGALTGGDTLEVAAGALLVLKGTSESPQISDGSLLLNMGTIRHEGTASLSIRGASKLENQGLFDITADADFTGASGAGDFINKSILRKSGGTGISSFNTWWDFINMNGAAIEVNSGELEIADLVSEKGSSISGTGTIDVPGSFVNNGIVSPGSSPGILTHIDRYSPSADGVLNIEIGGAEPGSGHDQLSISGNAALNGTINITMLNNFTPAAGDSFVVLKATGSVSDSFKTVTMPANIKLHLIQSDSAVVVVIDSAGTTVSAEQGETVITEYSLAQNYPNPFNPSTSIQFSLPENAFVTLEIFNLLGETVEVPVKNEMNAGVYRINWNAEGMASGIYIYRLSTKNYMETKKMLLVR